MKLLLESTFWDLFNVSWYTQTHTYLPQGQKQSFFSVLKDTVYAFYNFILSCCISMSQRESSVPECMDDNGK